MDHASNSLLRNFKGALRIEKSYSPLCRPGAPSLSHHHLDELLIVDLAIAIHVRLPDHLIDLLISKLLAKIRHDVTQLGGTDKSIAITVEHLECLDELLLRVCVLHLSCHQGQELREVDG